MRLPGYCTSCRRFKQVRVTGHAAARAHARGSNAVEGTCDACAQEEDDRRRGMGRLGQVRGH